MKRKKWLLAEKCQQAQELLGNLTGDPETDLKIMAQNSKKVGQLQFMGVRCMDCKNKKCIGLEADNEVYEVFSEYYQSELTTAH